MSQYDYSRAGTKLIMHKFVQITNNISFFDLVSKFSVQLPLSKKAYVFFRVLVAALPYSL